MSKWLLLPEEEGIEKLKAQNIKGRRYSELERLLPF